MKIKSKNTFFNTLLWWKISKDELENQITNYDSLNIWNSSRKISFLLLLFSCILTLVLVLFEQLDTSAYCDVILFLLFGVFVFLGHRWAIVFSMLLWTFEKGSLLLSGKQSPIIQIIWWCIYMKPFYLALCVEYERRKISAISKLTN